MSPKMMYELWEENPEVYIVGSIHSVCIIYQNGHVGDAATSVIQTVQQFLWEKNLFVVIISFGEVLYAGGYEVELEGRLDYPCNYEFLTGHIQDMIEVLDETYWGFTLSWIVTKNSLYVIDYVSLISLLTFSVGVAESEDELWFKLVEKYDEKVLDTLKNVVSFKMYLNAMRNYRNE